MKYPNFAEEKKLWNQGYEFVVGLDEAGRGPLAGPVVAAAVSVAKFNYAKFNIKKLNIKDSKKLSKDQREKVYEILTNQSTISWGVGMVSEKVIDEINILQATKLAMKKAISKLSPTPQSFEKVGASVFLILDGNFVLNSVKIPQKPIIRADEKVFSCAAAGIIAKVTRDKIMQKMHKKFPDYGFDKHKGYGTRMHIKKLLNFGPCKIHRKSFFPVSEVAKREIA